MIGKVITKKFKKTLITWKWSFASRLTGEVPQSIHRVQLKN